MCPSPPVSVFTYCFVASSFRRAAARSVVAEERRMVDLRILRAKMKTLMLNVRSRRPLSFAAALPSHPICSSFFSKAELEDAVCNAVEALSYRLYLIFSSCFG